MANKYDSTGDTIQHINRVRELLGEVIQNLEDRAREHDLSKLQEPEKSTFDRVTPRLKKLTYGSPEYREQLADMQVALQHHYGANRHHPEHGQARVCTNCFTDRKADEKECLQCGNGEFEPLAPTLTFMTLLDLIEMLADWKAAGERHQDGSIEQSLEHNARRFAIPPAVLRLLDLTVKEMKWGSPKVVQ